MAPICTHNNEQRTYTLRYARVNETIHQASERLLQYN